MTTINAQTERDGSALVSIDGAPAQKVKGIDLADARAKVMALAVQHAETTSAKVLLVASEPESEFRTFVHPDGRRESATGVIAPREMAERIVARQNAAPDPTSDGFLDEVFTPAPPTPATNGAAPTYISTRDVADDGDVRNTEAAQRWIDAGNRASAQPARQSPFTEGRTPVHRSAALGPTAPATPKRRANTSERPAQVPNRVGERPSFITAGRAVEPASQGWQGALNKIGFRLAPGPKEKAYREDVKAVAQHWAGLRTIAVANPKGSGNKTPTSINLAAQFALIGGAGVLAWDNNETRGSLPWRVDHADHEATILDLLPRVDALLAGEAQFSDLAHYVHHQTGDKFDALFSDQSVDGAHVVTAQDVDDVYRVAARYYRLAIVDSGNSERADNWLAMIDRADRLVVPCTNVEDTAEAAARMLESLAQRDEHSARLAREAVVIVSQRNSGRDPNMARIVGQFQAMGHEVVTIPHDPALVTGVIRHGQLRKATQRAWLSAAAAVARGL